MSWVLAHVALVGLFILVGGVFAGAEMALVSLREGQVRTLAGQGRRGQRLEALTANPARFLAALQVGVTVAGFLSAAFGAATLGARLGPTLTGWGVPAGDTVALVAVTVIISYLSLVFGELAPKRLALQRVEGTAMLVAPTVDRFARLVAPVIWALSRSSDLVVRALGGDPALGRERVSEGELRAMLASDERLGEEERELIGEVFAAGERMVREVMVPRTEVAFLRADMTVAAALAEVAGLPHSRYPVTGASVDDVVGFVHVRDLFTGPGPRASRVGQLVRPVTHLPGTKRVLAALQEMRRSGQHLAVVVDEYGGTAGIVTLEDVVEELVGEIRDEYDAPHPASRRLLDGAVEVDGLLNLEDLADETGLELPDGPYETLGGYLAAQLGHIPHVGESVVAAEHRLTVAGLDGRRVSQVRVEALPPTGHPDPTAGDPQADPAGGGGEGDEPPR